MQATGTKLPTELFWTVNSSAQVSTGRNLCNIHFSHICNVKANIARNDWQQIRAKSTLDEVFVIFHTCLYSSSMEVNWSPKGKTSLFSIIPEVIQLQDLCHPWTKKQVLIIKPAHFFPSITSSRWSLLIEHLADRSCQDLNTYPQLLAGFQRHQKPLESDIRYWEVKEREKKKTAWGWVWDRQEKNSSVLLWYWITTGSTLPWCLTLVVQQMNWKSL